MTLRLQSIIFSTLIFIISNVSAQKPVEQIAADLINAHEKNKAIPLITTNSEKADAETAYKVQWEYVKKRLENDSIAGFKAGLTSKNGQKKFNVQAPLSGVLFKSGELQNNCSVELSDFMDMRIETEIGFVIDKKITKAPQNLNEFLFYVRSVIPVIELPDLGFENMEQLTGIDLIAANVASSHFITGNEQKLDNLDVTQIKVTLSHNSKIKNAGKSSDAMGSQWIAAQWLVFMIIQQGYVIEPGSIIITGALGNMVKAGKGEYIADFGDLGTINFSIR